MLTETRHYYFSDQWQIVREMVSGSTAALYIWGPRYVDELLVRYDPTFGRKYAMQDANFNCTSICDDATGAGTVDERYQYDPYAGNRIILDSSWNVISASAYNWTVGHQGLMFEAEVGIYNCRNRVYLPMMGTWMQRDPLGYADGGNLYEYVAGNPVVNLDYSGLVWTQQQRDVLKDDSDSWWQEFYKSFPLPMPFDLPNPVHLLEPAPDVIRAWICTLYKNCVINHVMDCDTNPRCQYLGVLCDAAMGRTKVRHVCCSDVTFVPGYGPLVRPVYYTTICPQNMSDQQCCNKVPFPVGGGRQRHRFPTGCSTLPTENIIEQYWTA